MKDEFHDLTVIVTMSYKEADDLAEFMAAYGDDRDERVIAAIRYGMSEAVKERRRQDRAPIG